MYPLLVSSHRGDGPLDCLEKRRVVIHSLVRALTGCFIVPHRSALPNGGHLIGLLEYGIMLIAVLARRLQQKITAIADGVKGSPSLPSISCQAARPWILIFGKLLTSI